MKIVVLIPAYRPNTHLLELLRVLAAGNFSGIVLVDDGSGADYSSIFAAASEIPQVHLLTHAERR